MSATSPSGRSRTLLAAFLPALLAGAACTATNGEEPARDLRASEPPPAQDAAQVDAPEVATAWIVFGADTVVAEVARTEAERAQGLMYRETLPEDGGMLFIFPESSVRSFWMQNTYVPLDIAFMDQAFRIVDIQQMEPMTTDAHVSRAPAMYALEVNQGWFEAHGVRVGDTPEVVFGR